MSNGFFATHASLPVVVFAVALLELMSGCSQGKFPVAQAKGKVVCNGQPVTTGSVTFSPVGDSGLEAGKPATATVGSDGTFVLTTNNRFDGAVVGKHSVQYVASEGEEEEDGGAEKSPAEGSPEEAAQSAERIRRQRGQQRSQCVQKGEIVVEVKGERRKRFHDRARPRRELVPHIALAPTLCVGAHGCDALASLQGRGAAGLPFSRGAWEPEGGGCMPGPR